MSRLKITRKTLPLFFLFPLLVLLTVFLFSSGRDARAFDKLTGAIFKTQLSGNTLNLHFTLACPENYELERYPAILPFYSRREQLAAQDTLKNWTEALAAIDINRLDGERQYTYKLLSRSLSLSVEGAAYPYYEEPLSPSSGIQSQFPILLAEYAFRDIQDVEDYLALLDQTDEYFSSLLVYEQEKKQAGLLQADTSLNQVCDQCYAILSKKELAQGTHFLQTTFKERLENLRALHPELLSDEQIQKYLALNDRLLITVMQPAYEMLADGLFLLMGDGTTSPTGLCNLPNGREYYAWLIRKNTGSDLSPESIKALLYPQFDSEYKELRRLLNAREDAIELWVGSLGQNSFYLLNPDEILFDLQNRMEPLFPAFPEQGFSSPSPDVFVKYVSPSLENYCAPAFYFTPPLDDVDSNVIYINRKSTPEGLELYTTLAHEGYPGHLYQSVYHQLYAQKNHSDPVRATLWYGGYLEGWAVYTEFMAYDYAAALAAEQGDEGYAYACLIEKHNRSMQLCLYALLDLSIHYDGADYGQVHTILSGFGITDSAVTKRVYDYIAEEPANYLKYYLGYLEILRLKENARITWGEEYSDLRFHKFFLDCGPSDFATLADALR